MNTEIEANADGRFSDVSLIRGGPLYRILKAIKLIRSDRWEYLRQIVVAIAIGWGSQGGGTTGGSRRFAKGCTESCG